MQIVLYVLFNTYVINNCIVLLLNIIFRVNLNKNAKETQKLQKFDDIYMERVHFVLQKYVTIVKLHFENMQHNFLLFLKFLLKIYVFNP